MRTFLSRLLTLSLVLLCGMGTSMSAEEKELSSPPARGASEVEVRDYFGRPIGAMASGNREAWTYEDVVVHFVDGKVDRIIDRASNANVVRPAPVRKVEPAFFEDIRTQGDFIPSRRFLVPGKITVVVFYAEWDKLSRDNLPLLSALARSDPGVVVRRVDIDRWESTVATHYGVKTLPDMRVFDERGRMVHNTLVRFEDVKARVEHLLDARKEAAKKREHEVRQ